MLLYINKFTKDWSTCKHFRFTVLILFIESEESVYTDNPNHYSLFVPNVGA